MIFKLPRPFVLFLGMWVICEAKIECVIAKDLSSTNKEMTGYVFSFRTEEEYGMYVLDHQVYMLNKMCRRGPCKQNCSSLKVRAILMGVV